MSRSWFAALVAPALIGVASPLPAQTFAVEDPVLSQQTGQAQSWPACRDGQRTAPVTPR
jgi:hypothetical protein